MPVYEYACEACGATTEVLRRMADADEPLTCEKCGSGKTRRAHSVFAAASGGRETSLPVGGPGPGTCGHCGGLPGSCAMG